MILYDHIHMYICTYNVHVLDTDTRVCTNTNFVKAMFIDEKID